MNALTVRSRAALRAAWAPWQLRWSQTSAREQTWARLAALLALGALVWLIGIAPALRTLRTAQDEAPQLRAQLQTMRLLQDQARALQAQAAAQPSQDTQGLLEAALPTLGGPARLVLTGDRATVNLEGSSADALIQWLAQVRLNAQALPLELHLGQKKGQWSGSVVLLLPARAAP
jgi:general secretion pathway protein M